MTSSGFPRLLVWTRLGPNFPSGSPVILAEMLSRAPAEKIEVVSEYLPAHRLVRRIDADYRTYEYQGYRLLWPFDRGHRLRAWATVLTFPLMILYGLYRIYRFRPQCILTIYGFTTWLLSSYLLSVLTRVPIVYYVHDPYLERTGAAGPIERWIARHLEPRCLRHGTVVVLFETLQRRYRERYGVESVVIRHPARNYTPSTPYRRSNDSGATVGFSGTIYENNRDLLAHLVATTASLPNMRLNIWTNAGNEVLAGLGLPQPHVSTAFESNYDRLLDRLCQSDLLYLPLSFDGGASLPSDALNCVLPTKATDYLQTRRPILVHCPAGYELSNFFTSRKAAYVLNDDRPQAIRDWLLKWSAGKLSPLNPADIEEAVAEFDADEKAREFFDVLERAAAKS